MSVFDNKPAEKSAAKTPAQPAQSQPAQDQRQGNSGQGDDPGAGLGQALQTQHQARTEVPGHPGIDARLDNRAGAFRPPLEEWPAKPQQIDGPDVEHQVEHTRATLKKLTEVDGDVKGQYSPGPHGLSDEKLRETGDPLYGTESVENPKG